MGTTHHKLFYNIITVCHDKLEQYYNHKLFNNIFTKYLCIQFLIDFHLNHGYYLFFIDKVSDSRIKYLRLNLYLYQLSIINWCIDNWCIDLKINNSPQLVETFYFFKKNHLLYTKSWKNRCDFSFSLFTGFTDTRRDRLKFDFVTRVSWPMRHATAAHGGSQLWASVLGIRVDY